jgi:hypothetical protein
MSTAKQDAVELFDSAASDDSDGVTDNSASTSGETDESSLDVEESQASKDEREKQIRAHLRKLEDGKSTLEEIEEKQPWIADEIRKRLAKEEEPTVDIEALVEAKLEAKLQQEREREQFATLKNRINEVSTTKEQRAKATERFEALKDKLGDYEALKLAAELADIDLGDHLLRRQGMQVPRVGSGSQQSDDVNQKIMNQANLSQDEVRELARKKANRFSPNLQKK